MRNHLYSGKVLSGSDIDTLLMGKGKLVVLFKVCASAYGAAQDFGVGALFAVLSAPFFGLEPSLLILVLGAYCKVIPDMDILLPSLLGRTIAYNHHETIMHRPIVIVPAAAFVGLVIGSIFGHGDFGAWLAGICVFFHYIHDTPGGIAWAWPFSRKYWGPFGEVKVEALVDPVASHLHFIQNLLRPTWFSVRELTIGGVTMGIAINIVYGSHIGTLLSALGFIFVICSWIAYAAVTRQKVNA